MVRGPVRKVLDSFVLAASGCLSSLFVLWMPVPYKIWDIQQQELRLAIYGELSSYILYCTHIDNLLN